MPSDIAECPRCLLTLGVQGEPGIGTEDERAPSAGAPPVGPPPTLEEVRAAFPALEIEGLIGQGGMGAVFRARQPHLERRVALKVLPRALGDDRAFAERFAREARALARLAHPGIVTLHDFGLAQGFHFLVMELVEGLNLRELLRRGPLAPRQALAIARELCDALQYAHDEGVVHRDVKPENVLVDARGRVKVADFGLAKLVAAADGTLTRADQVMGTPHYMAPEQLERPREVDHRADLFALGVVLYEMLTGSLPRGNFEPPSRRVQVDVGLDSIVLKALEREPTRRYQHALEIKSDVDGLGGGGRSGQASAEGTRGLEPAVEREHDALRSGLKKSLVPFASLLAAWALFGASWNLGPVAAVLAALSVAGVLAVLVYREVRAVPEWLAALRALPLHERVGRGVSFPLGILLALFLVGLGHVAWWERGTHAWHPAPRGTDGMYVSLRNDPWTILRTASGTTPVHAAFAPETDPVVSVARNHTSALLDLEPELAWGLILGGVALAGFVLAASVHVRAQRALARRAWHLGGALGSCALLALLAAWVGAPMLVLRRHQVLQEIRAAAASPLAGDEARERLRAALEQHGLAVDVEQELVLNERRSARELARATILRAAAPDPFERWRTRFAGPLRRTPQVWAVLVPRLDGSGTHVELRAGLNDPRGPGHVAAEATVAELAAALEP
jgi:hypothetical protein